MKQTCKFCKDCDLQVHVPELATNIEKAIQTGVVKQEINIAEFNHIDIEQTQNISRLRETFDALEYKVSLKQAATEFSSGTGNVIAPAPTPPSSTDSAE